MVARAGRLVLAHIWSAEQVGNTRAVPERRHSRENCAGVDGILGNDAGRGVTSGVARYGMRTCRRSSSSMASSPVGIHWELMIEPARIRASAVPRWSVPSFQLFRFP